MATAMRIYRGQNNAALQDCEGTIKFTLLMNDLFDALNIKNKEKGLTPGSVEWVLFVYICTKYFFIYFLFINAF